MKKQSLRTLFACAVLALAVLFLLPTTAYAQDTDKLSDYVDIETFRTYVREEFFAANADVEATFLGVDLRKFEIPFTSVLVQQLKKECLIAIPELYTIGGWDVVDANTYQGGSKTEVGMLRVILNASAYKNNTYFEQINRIGDVLLYDIENNAQLTEVEKALLLHDRLAVWTEYDYENFISGTIPGISYTAYGALVNRASVCSGYAEAYGYLLARAGIYSEYCSSSALNHGWNIVYIDGVPYHVDVTWDDPVSDQVGYVRHDNFLRSTDGIMATGHLSWDYVDYDTTPSDTTYDNYYWQCSETEFQLIGDSFYYIDNDMGDIIKSDGKTHSQVASVSYYSMLSSVEDKLLYNIGNEIRMLDPQTGADQMVWELDQVIADVKGDLNGVRYEKGHIVCQISWWENGENVYTLVEKQFRLTTEPGWYEDRYGSFYLEADGRMKVNCWLKDSTDWRYLDSDGYVAYEQWCEDSLGRYYANAEGYLARNQWAPDGDHWRYLGSNGKPVKNRWIEDQYGIFYVDDTGCRLEKSWKHDGTGWRYLNAFGRSLQDQEVVVGDEHYFLDSNGYRVSGWLKNGYAWSWYDNNGVKARGKWFNDGTGWCYANHFGSAMESSWLRISGADISSVFSPSADAAAYYYFDANRHMVTGKTQIGDDALYWFDGSGVLAQNGWVYTGTNYVYANEYGRLVCGNWIYDDGTALDLYSYATADMQGGKLYYMDDQGNMAVGWEYIRDMWYWFDSDGVKAKNRWVSDSEGWCYLGNAGNTLINCWVEDTVGKCYLDSNGRMIANSWVHYNNSWYFVDAEGHMVTGWRLIGGVWYYFNTRQEAYGRMAHNCWGFDNGEGLKLLAGDTKSSRIRNSKCYYFDENGAMATGWKLLDGAWLWFDASGAMVKNGWALDSVGWCYLTKDGTMATNKWIMDSVGWCYVGPDGYCITNCWMKDSYGWCYLDASGRMVTNGWVMDSKGWCYLGSDGYAVTNCWKQDSVGWCYLDSEGSMVKNAWVDGYYINSDGYRT